MHKPEPFLTKVSRTKVIEGRSIPAFIHNRNYFYVDLDIFEDGVIWCWESTDLDLFKQKLQTGWVETSVPNGEPISIHGLGSWKIDNGNWLFDKDGFYEYVLRIIKEMNPEMRNLYQVFEKKINGVTFMEDSAGNVFRENKRYENDIFPEKIKGDGFHLFYKNNDEYFLAWLSVFADKKIEINNLPEKIELDFNTLEVLVESGLVLTEIPQNAEVRILGLGAFTAVEARYAVSIEDKLLEIQDLLKTLNNRPDSIKICSKIYDEYLQNPTLEIKEKLKIAYENIPKHQRKYVGDMDVKDTAVRMIIYGEQEIQNWSHYIAAKTLGQKLPTITIPKPKDE